MKDRLCEKGYEILNIVGKGSFSTVYRLREMKTGRHCACKVSENQKMLFREAELLRRLEHPLFPVFYDFWQQEKEACLVMEYIAGTSLEKLVGDRGRLTDRRASRIGLELASGLAYLHELPIPILHRDITPGNILIRQDGRVKLLDRSVLQSLILPQEFHSFLFLRSSLFCALSGYGLLFAAF